MVPGQFPGNPPSLSHPPALTWVLLSAVLAGADHPQAKKWGLLRWAGAMLTLLYFFLAEPCLVPLGQEPGELLVLPPKASGRIHGL